MTRAEAEALGVPAHILAQAYPSQSSSGRAPLSAAAARPSPSQALPRPSQSLSARRSWTFVVEGRPAPKSRPRVTQNGTYTPKHTVAFERAVFDGALAVGIEVGSQAVRVEVRIYYADRGGADPANVMAAVMDGLVGRKRGKGLARRPMADDRWTVARQGGWMCALDKDRPRVEVEVQLLEVA